MPVSRLLHHDAVERDGGHPAEEVLEAGSDGRRRLAGNQPELCAHLGGHSGGLLHDLDAALLILKRGDKIKRLSFNFSVHTL